MDSTLLIENVKRAAETLKGVSRQTPLEYNVTYSKRYNTNLLIKREDLQPVRSYKIRGAYNKIMSLSPEEIKREVVCASAGNHAQGVAYSCEKLNIQGTIFMPSTTPAQKIEQVKMFGKSNINVMLTGDTFDDTKQEALRFSELHKSPFIHPFDDLKIIEGQATIALEILKDADKPIDYLFVPVGGGGLAAGLSTVFKSLSPDTKIIGVEPKGAPSMSTAIQHDRNDALPSIDRFVDGAAVKRVGDLSFAICKSNLDEMIVVDEGKICETILDLYNRDAIVVEPAGALTIAALDQFQDKLKDKTVVCIVSGGNNDITRMEEIKERAMLYKGLKHYFLVHFPQRAGALKEFVAEVLGRSDDITHFEYIKKNSREKGYAVVGIELNDKADFDPLLQRMKKHQFFGDYLNTKESLLAILT